MPEIEIRPASSTDIPVLINLDHDYSTDYAWQLDVKTEEDQVNVNFRKVRLPRSVRVEYPRDPRLLGDDWSRRDALLVALLEGEPVGYISVNLDIAPATNWVTDLAVIRRIRRQGIGSALVLAAQEWAREFNGYRMVLEMQPKNHAAISMAQKLGFDLCGYNDRYYMNRDIALFFCRSVR
jgi:GNAT superfamily N-acetyltransferase